MRRSIATTAVALLGVAVMAGCSTDDAGSDSLDMGYEDGYAASDGAYEQSEESDAYYADVEAAADMDGGTSAANRIVIQTGYVTMTTEDPVATAASVSDLAARVGGRTDARQVTSESEYQHPSASLTLRIPADKLDGVLADLRELGTVAEENVSVEDVTLASQDLDARIEAKKLSIERLENLLAEASTTSDVIDAENSLTQRQVELEQLQAEQAWLAEQVALSTLEVWIGVPDEVPVVEPTGFSGGVANGWDSLVAFVTGLVAVLGFLLPWLGVAALVAALVWFLLRSRRSRAKTASDRAADGDGDGDKELAPASEASAAQPESAAGESED